MRLSVILLALIALSTACTSKDQLKKTLEDNPEILTNVIEKHPKLILESLNKAVEKAKGEAQKEQAEQEQKSLEEEYKNPKVAEIKPEHIIFGNKDAKITIIEYSDFECPFCSRGYNTIKEVRKEYGDKVRVIYKHLPLSFHPHAEPAAKFFAAIALQGADKAEKFHDLLFENQTGLQKGEAFLKEMAKKAGANVDKAMKDKDSEKVTALIEADKAEAEKFGFSGTPGFLVNGVSVRGAYPFEHFKKIIDRHLGAN